MNNILKKKIFFLSFIFTKKKLKILKKRKIKFFKLEKFFFKKLILRNIISHYSYLNIKNILLYFKKPIKKIFNIFLINKKNDINLTKKYFIKIINFKNKQFYNYKKSIFKTYVLSLFFLINKYDFINYWLILKNIKKIFLNKIKNKNYIIFYNRMLILKLSNL
ncbi:hypothetical protein CRP_180 [Candidatus Carsonella ruddii PV]|uniref:Uncharacterized protein n=1 Tax=Carsonella ruddii (strain PV) TaxID=387662 RepID=Q05FG0_CARRP|nr:hypothetical protein [Candidatus Carsonella ruddii]BAF35211.1 hypothetical protein CRP_180 [Candidatus Carsonella ruddii PV]